jgi:hypothetical protein
LRMDNRSGDRQEPAAAVSKFGKINRDTLSDWAVGR